MKHYTFIIGGFKNSHRGWKRTLRIQLQRGHETFGIAEDVSEESEIKIELKDNDKIHFIKCWSPGREDVLSFTPSIGDKSDTFKVNWYPQEIVAVLV